jgi:manganese/zinc/iron transport system substrate-binding protein
MKSFLKYAIFFSLLLSLTFLFLMGCSRSSASLQEEDKFDQWLSEENKIRVLSTVGMIDDLVHQVGGEHVACLVLISGGLDPHSYELVKGDNEKFSAAQVVFFNGLNLEHGPSLLHYIHEHPCAVGVGDAIAKRSPDDVIRMQKQLDPHIWMDVSLWLQGVDTIVETLSLQDPEHAAAYHNNGDALKQRLEGLHEQIQQTMAFVPLDKRYLVTTHDAFNYFARRYLALPEERTNGRWIERCKSPEGLSPEGQLSATDIYHIIHYLEKYQITVLFPESNLSQDSIKKIVQAGLERGLNVHVSKDALYADAMGETGSLGDTYEKMMEYDALIISKNMSGEKISGRTVHE